MSSIPRGAIEIMSQSRNRVKLFISMVLIAICISNQAGLAAGPLSRLMKSEDKTGGNRTGLLAKKSTDEKASKDSSEDSEKKSESDKKSDKEPKLYVTHHTMNIGGKQILYKATTGYMLLKDFKEKKSDEDKKSNSKNDKDDKDSKGEQHKTRARVFFVSYEREDAGPRSDRPICFCFNGGPGSASVWLHMGALGPKRAALTADGEALPPPYTAENNSYSWLDGSDLVFIDPVSTGFSRTEPGEDPKSFHGVEEDIESVGEFIRLYITKNQRWNSPKFLVGESYGTTRAAGLSNYLQDRYAIYLNGIVLVSSVLNFGTLDFAPGNDLPYLMYLPSFAATAWYHKRLSPDLQSKGLESLLAEVEEYSSNQYLLSLFKGSALSDSEARNMAVKVSSYTGLSPDYVAKLSSRIPDNLFFTHLLMSQNKQVGRFDSRYTGIRYNPGRDRNDFDPSFEAVNGPFTAAFNDYIRRDLKFESELPYETLANVWPWSFKSAENRYLNVADDLRKAMSRNPYLRVWICSGYYDLATPYFASKYTVDQMMLDPTIRKNVNVTYYESGHMMYVTRSALQKMKADFETFLGASILPDSAVVPSAAPSVAR